MPDVYLYGRKRGEAAKRFPDPVDRMTANLYAFKFCMDFPQAEFWVSEDPDCTDPRPEVVFRDPTREDDDA